VKKVLVVDDSVSMRQMVGFTLREGGFEVIEAEHGQDALDKLKSVTVDLVITDLNMPVMDGITLIQNLRQQPAMKAKPILMLTTEGLASKKEQGKAAGASGWLVKPFDPEKLLQTIAKVLP
jgi:two-component system chemotaxis response regulator CheY